ncbi:MAG: ABC transporter permease [bacterium]
MLRDVRFIARQDLWVQLRARETLLWVFVMPILFFYFIGTVTGGFGGHTEGKRDPLALREGKNAGFLADEIATRLTAENYDVLRAPSDSAFAASPRRMSIPSAFTDSVLAGGAMTVRYEHDRSGLGSDEEKVRVGRAVYGVLADLVVSEMKAVVDSAAAPHAVAPRSAAPHIPAPRGRAPGTPGAQATPEDFAKLRAMPRSVSLSVTSAGKRREIPHGFEQSVPGILVMFTLLIMTTSGAVLVVIERHRGLLRRLACAPITRRSVVGGKWAGMLAVGLVQIAFGMAAGTVLFKVSWGPDLPFVFVVMLVYAALMAAVGLVLGSLVRSEGQASAIGVISSNVLGALGGCWWPMEIAPKWMQKLALCLPTGWAMDALHKLVSFAAGPASVLPHLVGMTLATIVMLAVASRVFRYQ